MKTCVWLVALSLCTASSRSFATDNFPDALKNELAMSAPPDCTVCHSGGERRGTVTTPFGKSMRSRGLVASSEDSLKTAIAALRAEKIDSDADGTTDVDELAAGRDPNVAGNGDAFPPPAYGCSAVPGSGGAPAAPLLAFGLAWIVRRLRRHR